VLYLVVCGAGPAREVGTLVAAAQANGWQVHLIATPAGREFLDVAALESQTGQPVSSAYRDPDQPRRSAPPADAIIVAPATYNTINKLAHGLADNYALGLLAECIGLDVPVVIVPFINTALARRAPLQAAVAALRDEGVRVLLGPGGFEPHPPGDGGSRIATFPWTQALAEAAAAAAAGKRV
jgi:phosphopantothenoylcysteine synthetase/decarboxylase